MPETKEPHWPLTVAKIAGIVTAAIFCAQSVWGKADKSEVSELDKRIQASETAQAVSIESQKWILQDLQKANEKLDKILNALYFPRDPGSLHPPSPTPSPLGR
jgi:hypothetical protein